MKNNPGNLSRAAPEFFSPQVAKARRFYLNLQPRRGARLAVVCGGVEHCRADYAIQRETFPFYSIEYVASGHGELKLAECRHKLQPGRLFAYPTKFGGERERRITSVGRCKCRPTR